MIPFNNYQIIATATNTSTSSVPSSPATVYTSIEQLHRLLYQEIVSRVATSNHEVSVPFFRGDSDFSYFDFLNTDPAAFNLRYDFLRSLVLTTHADNSQTLFDEILFRLPFPYLESLLAFTNQATFTLDDITSHLNLLAYASFYAGNDFNAIIDYLNVHIVHAIERVNIAQTTAAFSSTDSINSINAVAPSPSSSFN